MAIGDQQDMFLRLVDDLVPWFGDIEGYTKDSTGKIIYKAPVVRALLQGTAYTDSVIYNEDAYVNLQTRIKTATDVNLDYIALDYFGNLLARHLNENDASFRNRILANLIQEKATRNGMIQVLTKLTGRVPIVIEGFNNVNIGAYDQNLYYDKQGGSGFLGPYIAIIYAFRPQPAGFFGYAGYDQVDGYGFGYDFYSNNAYIDISKPVVDVSDSDILFAIEHTKVYGTYIYTFIFD